MTITNYSFGHSEGLGDCLFLQDGPDGTHVIPLEAIASWGALLGEDDPGRVLEHMLYVREHGEPDPDPVTGENAWTAAYNTLGDREQASAREQIEGRPQHALQAAHAQTDNVALGQDQTRSILGLPPVPQFQPVPLGRMTTMPIGPPTALQAAKQALAERVGIIAKDRHTFLTTLAPQIPERE